MDVTHAGMLKQVITLIADNEDAKWYGPKIHELTFQRNPKSNLRLLDAISLEKHILTISTFPQTA